MLKKLREQMEMFDIVLASLINVLDKKGIVKRDEVQKDITEQALKDMEGEREP